MVYTILCYCTQLFRTEWRSVMSALQLSLDCGACDQWCSWGTWQSCGKPAGGHPEPHQCCCMAGQCAVARPKAAARGRCGKYQSKWPQNGVFQATTSTMGCGKLHICVMRTLHGVCLHTSNLDQCWLTGTFRTACCLHVLPCGVASYGSGNCNTAADQPGFPQRWEWPSMDNPADGSISIFHRCLGCF